MYVFHKKYVDDIRYFKEKREYFDRLKIKCIFFSRWQIKKS